MSFLHFRQDSVSKFTEFWSQTGNTEAMAKAVAESIKEKGSEAVMLTASEFHACFFVVISASANWKAMAGRKHLE